MAGNQSNQQAAPETTKNGTEPEEQKEQKESGEVKTLGKGKKLLRIKRLDNVVACNSYTYAEGKFIWPWEAFEVSGKDIHMHKKSKLEIVGDVESCVHAEDENRPEVYLVPDAESVKKLLKDGPQIVDDDEEEDDEDEFF